ncbi:MAG: hypothetical protein JSS02_27600 [Planctomycetes bacterium]|nr:hypothetical protein [Planctomycetota bacterium]
MLRLSIRTALCLVMLVVSSVDPARASYIDIQMVTQGNQWIDSSASTGTVALSQRGNGSFCKGQTSYGVNKVLTESSGNGSFVSGGAESSWLVNFNLSGAPVNTPVHIEVDIAYDFTINAPGGSAGWALILNDGSRDHKFVTYTDAYGALDDHSFDQPGGGDDSGPHAGILRIDCLYHVQNGLSLRVAVQTNSGGGGEAMCDAFNTARVTDVILPEGIQWTYADISGNPLNVHSAQAVPELSSLFLLSTCGFTLMLCRVLARGGQRGHSAARQ